MRCTLLHIIGILFTGLAFAQDSEIVVYEVDDDTNLAVTANQIRAAGGEPLTLSPEGRLYVQWPELHQGRLGYLTGLTPVDVSPAPTLLDDSERVPEFTPGWDSPSRKSGNLNEVCTRVTALAPNELSRQRAALEGRTDRPTQVSNAISKYFPAIGNQWSEGTCTTWAACYYWNTYTQALDEDLDTYAPNKSENICSAEFLFNLVGKGNLGGSDVLDVMAGMRDMGCATLSESPMDYEDVLAWPTETAWLNALKQRTGACRVIGTPQGCTDADLELIKQHLSNGNVAVVGLEYFANWSNWSGQDKAGINNGVFFAPSGSDLGGHGLCLVGFDDNRPYFDGTTTRHGAFLLANQWSFQWGKWELIGPVPYRSGGFIWVSYDYFKIANAGFDDNLGMAFFNEDLPDYRPRLVAIMGINHPYRGQVSWFAGIGSPGTPAWMSPVLFNRYYGLLQPLSDQKRVVVDMTEALPAITSFNDIRAFARITVGNSPAAQASLTSAEFLHDLRHQGVYEQLASADTPLEVPAAQTAHANAQFALSPLTVSPGPDYDDVSAGRDYYSFEAHGPQGGPFNTDLHYTLANHAGTSASWSASADVNWLHLSSTSGVLGPSGAQTTLRASISTAANVLAIGAYDGLIRFESQGVVLLRSVRLKVRPATRLSLHVTPDTGPPGAQRTLTIFASDTEGKTVSALAGSAALKALVPAPATEIGAPDFQMHWPLAPNYRNGRWQAIYRNEEVGAAGWLTSLALNLISLPGSPLRNWTLRMKHTSLESVPYTNASWESTGWTTVYQRDEVFPATGWWTCNFDTPFLYNGSSNLMIDFSFSGIETLADYGLTHWAATPEYRCVVDMNERWNDDPLLWTGPKGYGYSGVPNLQLGRGTLLAVTPENSGAFSQGRWQGAISAPGASAPFRFYALTPQGIGGASGLVGTQTPGDNDDDGLNDSLEGSGDFDFDGIPNFMDLDSDGDGWSDADEGAEDTDNDSSPDFLDISNGLVWLDFGWLGIETGSRAHPFNSLAKGLNAVAAGGVISIKGDTALPLSSESPRISTPVRITAVGGAIRLGVAASKISESSATEEDPVPAGPFLRLFQDLLSD